MCVDACDVYAMDAVDADEDGNGDNLLRLTHDNSQNCSRLGGRQPVVVADRET